MKAYRITNTDGRDGRVWRGLYESKADARLRLEALYGWEENSAVLSESFTVIDGDGKETRAWCLYETQEACDADSDGAFAPRIVEVDA